MLLAMLEEWSCLACLYCSSWFVRHWTYHIEYRHFNEGHHTILEEVMPVRCLTKWGYNISRQIKKCMNL